MQLTDTLCVFGQLAVALTLGLALFLFNACQTEVVADSLFELFWTALLACARCDLSF